MMSLSSLREAAPLTCVLTLIGWLSACNAPQESNEPETQVSKRETRSVVRDLPSYDKELFDAEPISDTQKDETPAKKEEPPVEAPPKTDPPKQNPTPPQDTTDPPKDRFDNFADKMRGIGEDVQGRGDLNTDYINSLSIEDEIAIGEGIASLIANDGLLFEPESVIEYLALIAATIGAISDRPQMPYVIGMLDDETLNAMATPGGFIFVNKGTILMAEDEAELAAVIAHEIAHVVLRHGLREVDASKYRIMSQDAFDRLDDALRERGSLPKIRIDDYLQDVADSAYQSTRNGYSRDYEREADDLAVIYMVAVGYDPNAFIDMLSRLDRTHDNDPIRWLLQSHPSTTERIENIRRAIQRLGNPSGQRLKERFQERTAALRS